MFRLALLVLFLTALPVFAEEVKPTAAEGELIALVEKLGGTAKIDTSLDGQARVAAAFEKPDDTALVTLGKQPPLGSLEVGSAAKLTAKGYTALKELPDLQKLTVSSGTVAPADATAIGSLRQLSVLVLGGCKLTDAEVVKLAKLKNLKCLDLLDTGVSDKAVDTLLGFTKLEELNLSGTKLSDAGAKKLLKLEGLKLLQLNNTKVSAAAIGTMEDDLKADKRGLKILR